MEEIITKRRSVERRAYNVSIVVMIVSIVVMVVYGSFLFALVHSGI